MRQLGVGLVYLTELDQLFRESNPDLSVLELEPETFWEKFYPPNANGAVIYVPNAQAMAHVSALPQHKLVHSVGFPVGGTVCYGGDYVTPLVDCINKLGAIWASEHLSFNAIEIEDGVEQIGFLLPPRQTRSGADTAIRNIQRLASRLPVPFAFETGVNYLQTSVGEMSDGEFFALIAEEANCGILLDLHNLWVNERNGRQAVREILQQLPLERVWEVHVAGGMMLGEYYLDSHSDVVPQPLMEIAAELVPRLPNLGALIFEVLPHYVQQLGLDKIRHQLKQLNTLWRLRPARSICVPRRVVPMTKSDERDDVVEWERALGMLAVEHTPAPKAYEDRTLNLDPGVKILQRLIGEFRDGQISRAMRYTITLLLAVLGPNEVHQLLNDYHSQFFPDIFTSGEADRFARYLSSQMASLPHVPFLAEVLNFEHALVRAALHGVASRIEWGFDPADLFSALESGKLPTVIRTGRSVMDIVPEA